MRWAVVALMLLHGLMHLVYVAKGPGLGESHGLADPGSTRAGITVLAASAAMVGAAVLFVVAPRAWWVVGLGAAALSQATIFVACPDARLGTIANALVLVLALHGFASRGPLSLGAQYRAGVDAQLSRVRPQGELTENDLLHLPEPVRAYIRRSGALGQPRITHFRATWKGRIRATGTDPWMEFTAEQYNFVDPPARYFSMVARRAGSPVDVLHVFADASARMNVRLLSLVPLASGAGAKLTRAETVTLFNDLSILAPGALADPGIRWTTIDSATVRAEYTIGPNTIRAVLSFDEAANLIDFVSDDRLVASADGRDFTRQRWSTPLSDYRRFGPWRVAAHGEGWWHPQDAPSFPYIELDLIALEINPSS